MGVSQYSSNEDIETITASYKFFLGLHNEHKKMLENISNSIEEATNLAKLIMEKQEPGYQESKA